MDGIQAAPYDAEKELDLMDLRANTYIGTATRQYKKTTRRTSMFLQDLDPYFARLIAEAHEARGKRYL